MLKNKLAFLFLFLLLPLSAHAQDLKGKLLIVGGGTTTSAIYEALKSNTPAKGTLGLIPIASETPEETGQRSLAAWSKRFPDLKVLLLDVSPAGDEASAKLIDTCDSIFFAGGDQSRITAALHPSAGPSKSALALDRLLARGGLISGSSAGAAMMCDPMITGGIPAKAFTPSTQPAVPTGPGMGYFPWGLLDQHFLQRGRLGRSIVALRNLGEPFGYGLSESRAMLVDRAAHTFTTVGIDSVVFQDRRQAKDLTNIRLSLLGHADSVNTLTGEVTPAPGKQLAPPLPTRTGDFPSTRPAFAPLVFGPLLHTLATSPHKSASATEGKTTLTFTVDDSTKIYLNPSDPSDLTILNLRLDVQTSSD